MKIKEDMLNCPLGLYRIYWKDGGTSLASIGNLYSGSRWLACANWTSPGTAGVIVELKDYVEQIEMIELLNNARNEYKEETKWKLNTDELQGSLGDGR